MKQILIVLLVFICSSTVFSQESNCGCDTINIIPENRYKCDTTVFTNGAMMYWQWNCDSSWLTFENREKLILKSCDEVNVYGCLRTGLNFQKEYPNYLLFIYKWISGCCTPPDIVLISKDNGREIKRIPNVQFVWGDSDEDYVLYFSDITLNELIYLDHNTEDQYVYQFENGKIQGLADKNQTTSLSDLFENFKKNDENFTFDLIVSNEEKERIVIKI